MKYTLKPLLAAIACLCLYSCIDKDLYMKPNDPPRPESEYFDFNTTKDVQVSIDYGPQSSYALLHLFTENPIKGTAQNDEVSGTPFFSIFADKDGRFVGKIAIPAAIEEVYIYSPTWGAPTIVKANVQNDRLAVTIRETPLAKAKTRAVAEPQVFKKGENIYCLFHQWDKYGNIRDYDTNGLLSDGDFDPNKFAAVQKFLWKGKTSKPSGLDNSEYAKPTNVINTTLLSEVDGQTVESVEIYFNFLTEAAWNENSIGYYYYKTDEVPANPSNLKKYIILPNASIPYEVPYTEVSSATSKINPSLAPCKTNMKVQLLYVDEETGKVSTQFPPGYTVGYFIIAGSMGGGSTHYEDIKYNYTTYYSNQEWNANQQSRYIALEANDGSIIYGLEDSTGDKSYDDILFNISASPNFAIKKDPELPKVDVDVTPEEVFTTETTKHTYLFEDIWPDGGDYDLNDVIVEHTSAVTFNRNNLITSIEDTFSPVQPAGSATFKDAFGIQLQQDVKGNITLGNGSVEESTGNSFIIFDDAREDAGQSFSMKREFTSLIKKTSYSQSDMRTLFNPFIVVNYVPGADNRTEVHLPKGKATPLANPEQIGHSDDAYYINKDGLHPFALDLPIHGFSPVTERTTIGSTSSSYPLYNTWVDSKGTKNTDWYKYKNGK